MTAEKEPEGPPPPTPSQVLGHPGQRHDGQHGQQLPEQGDYALVADGFEMPNSENLNEAPPAYGELPEEIQFSRSDVDAGARVTEDGRVDINLNSKTRVLANLLGKTLPPETAAPLSPLPPAYIPPSLGGQPGQTPPPRLNVVIQIVGSRGDVQPFVALGQVLRDTYGHRVRVATHPTFDRFVEDAGLEFFSIGGDPAELMAFMVKNPGLLPGIEALKSGEISRRRKSMEEILEGCWRSCSEAGTGMGPAPKPHGLNAPLEMDLQLPGDPANRPFVADAIIANPPSFAHIHIAEKMGIPLHMMFTMPWSPTRAFPHPLANIKSSNADDAITNYVSYAMVEMMTWQGLGDVINRFREKTLGLDGLSLMWAPGLLQRLRIPYTYCWSPALIPKPNDWDRGIDISGFFFLNLATSYTPAPDLAEFLESGPPPVYIGFGSIVVDDPNHLTRMIFDAIHLTGCRALVSQGWGGLGADDVGIPPGVFMLGNCPHDWLFQRVSAVVHHGGAGTTAAGINAGKPTVVVPFFGDQPFWGAMIARAGAGPDAIPYNALTAERLAAAISQCLKPETQARAQELGQRIREEKGCDVGGKSFHDHLDIETMRCSIAPSRVAVWRVRRTKVRLSVMAAEVLVQKGQIKYSDLKLYHPKEYNTDDQPWEPISAGASCLVADISALMMGVADLPRDIFKAASKSRAKRAESESEKKESEDAASTVPPSDVASMAAMSRTSMIVSDSSSARPTTSGEASMAEASTVPSITATDQDPAGQARPLLPGATMTETPRSQAHPIERHPSSKSDSSRAAADMSLEAAIGAGKGVSRIVVRGAKTPLNFCLGLAKGFRNAPRLYNDDTVRPQEKVTDFASGLRVAGKEFGFGLYDGLSGLVTQPLKGAEKEGGIGLLKGVGKGIGGLVLKPSAGMWAIPAYTMQGAHAEIKNYMAKSVDNYIITSRILQGKEEVQSSTPEEMADVMVRWDSVKYDLKGFHALQLKEKSKSEERLAAAQAGPSSSLSPPRTGWAHTRKLSFGERKKLHEQKNAWKAGHIQVRIPTDGSSRDNLDAAEDAEFEKAIRASVRETSMGNAEEDARVEEAIRASLAQLRQSDSALQVPVPPGTRTADGDEHLEITEEEFQELIGRAIQESVSQAGRDAAVHGDDEVDDEDLKRAIEQSMIEQGQIQKPLPLPLPLPSQLRPGSPPIGEVPGEDEELRRAIEASTQTPVAPANEDEDLRRAIEASTSPQDEELRRVLEQSEAEHRDKMARESSVLNEEEIVLEYVKRQSLAEEEFRRQREKGKMRSGEGEGDDDDEDEMRRAMEESLRISSGRPEGEGGPSGI